MLCYSCNKQKNQLSPVDSKIIKGSKLLMCATCIEGGFEPKWAIIMGGRQFGPEYVKEYILKRKYVGQEILANELIVD
jgi:hypothetical protein